MFLDPAFPRLAPVSVHPSWPRRALPDGHTFRDPADSTRYDATTLWYDAFRRERMVYLVCPRLNNLASVISGGTFSVGDASPKAITRRTYPWYETISLSGLPQGSRLDFAYSGVDVRGELFDSAIDAEPFRGLNVAVTLSRDNCLPWLRDWAHWHVRHHGLQAVLLFDNDSTRTTPGEIREALLRAGLHHAAVVSAPFAYGPVLAGPLGQPSFAGHYLQTALLNIARLRFLRHARAVLQCDVDELVEPADRSVFDAAARSLLGVQILSGAWRYPPRDQNGPFRHGDHTFRSPTDEPCGGKYCATPNGIASMNGWAVHRPENRLFQSRPERQRYNFWHCKGIASSPGRLNWHHPPDLCPDAGATAAFAAFPWSTSRL